MDYLVGFLAGYYIRIFFNYLKKIADYRIIEDHEWDWLSTDDEQ